MLRLTAAGGWASVSSSWWWKNRHDAVCRGALGGCGVKRASRNCAWRQGKHGMRILSIKETAASMIARVAARVMRARRRTDSIGKYVPPTMLRAQLSISCRRESVQRRYIRISIGR